MNNSIKDIKTINPKPTDIIVLRFNEIPMDEMNFWFKQVQDKFPDNKVVALPSNAGLEVASKELWEDYIRMVDEYIRSM